MQKTGNGMNSAVKAFKEEESRFFYEAIDLSIADFLLPLRYENGNIPCVVLKDTNPITSDGNIAFRNVKYLNIGTGKEQDILNTEFLIVSGGLNSSVLNAEKTENLEYIYVLDKDITSEILQLLKLATKKTGNNIMKNSAEGNISKYTLGSLISQKCESLRKELLLYCYVKKSEGFSRIVRASSSVLDKPVTFMDVAKVIKEVDDWPKVKEWMINESGRSVCFGMKNGFEITVMWENEARGISVLYHDGLEQNNITLKDFENIVKNGFIENYIFEPELKQAI